MKLGIFDKIIVMYKLEILFIIWAQNCYQPCANKEHNIKESYYLGNTRFYLLFLCSLNN